MGGQGGGVLLVPHPRALLALAEVERLVDAFPVQSIDFFGALRARVYDDKVTHHTTCLSFYTRDLRVGVHP